MFSQHSLWNIEGRRSDERRQTKNTLQSGKSIAAIYISGKIIDRVGKDSRTISHLSLIFRRLIWSSTRYLSIMFHADRHVSLAYGRFVEICWAFGILFFFTVWWAFLQTAPSITQHTFTFFEISRLFRYIFSHCIVVRDITIYYPEITRVKYFLQSTCNKNFIIILAYICIWMNRFWHIYVYVCVVPVISGI